MSLVNDFLIGCDPEFVAMDGNGAVVNCSRHIAHDGELGHDHGGWVLEFRPSPEKSTWRLVQKLARLVEDRRIGEIPGIKKTRAGAYVPVPQRGAVTLGGHVHIDIDPYDHQKGGLTEAHKERVRALDTLTVYLEGLDILPKGESDSRRATGAYGHYGDVRVQKKIDPQGRPPAPPQTPVQQWTTGTTMMWYTQPQLDLMRQNLGVMGSGLTFAPAPPPVHYKYHTEYRTMASWMFDPRVAMLCLTGAKLAAVDPKGTQERLGQVSQSGVSFTGLKSWYELFRSKDINAKRVCDTVLDEGIEKVQVYPDVDFRERWAM